MAKSAISALTLALVMLYSCGAGSTCLPADPMDQLAMLDIYQLGMIRVKV